MALSASHDTTLKLWNLARAPEAHIAREHESIISAITITPDNNQAVSASWDSTLKVWDLTGVEQRTLIGHNMPVIVCSTFARWKPRHISFMGSHTQVMGFRKRQRA
jgi:WD40 repeat protein